MYKFFFLCISYIIHLYMKIKYHFIYQNLICFGARLVRVMNTLGSDIAQLNNILGEKPTVKK